MTQRQVRRYVKQIASLEALEELDAATIVMLPYTDHKARMRYLGAVQYRTGQKPNDGIPRVSADQVKNWFAARRA